MMKFLIADDHALIRKGLMQMLIEEFPTAIFTEVSNGQQVLEKVKEQVWDIIFIDISMPGRNGIEILKQMRTNGIKAPILMLSSHPEDQYALRVLKAGASGYVCKENTTEELLVAVHRVLQGRKYISPLVAEKLADIGDNTDGPAHENLSDREMQVFQLIALGKSVSEIANEISLSVNTISTYRSRILEKLDLSNNAEIVRYAIENELV